MKISGKRRRKKYTKTFFVFFMYQVKTLCGSKFNVFRYLQHLYITIYSVVKYVLLEITVKYQRIRSNVPKSYIALSPNHIVDKVCTLRSKLCTISI